MPRQLPTIGLQDLELATPQVEGEARGLDDKSKRQALYEEASRLVVSDAADIWIYNAIELRGLSNRLHGFHFTPIGSGADFRMMSLTS